MWAGCSCRTPPQLTHDHGADVRSRGSGGIRSDTSRRVCDDFKTKTLFSEVSSLWSVAALCQSTPNTILCVGVYADDYCLFVPVCVRVFEYQKPLPHMYTNTKQDHLVLEGSSSSPVTLGSWILHLSVMWYQLANFWSEYKWEDKK